MKVTRYRLLTILALFVFRALSPVPAAAQSVATPTLGFTPAALDSVSRGNPSAIDNIDLLTGALTLRIPLLHIGGRGTVGFTSYFRVNRSWTINRGMRLGNCVPSYNCSYTDEYYVSRDFGVGGALVARHAGYDSQVSCSWSPGSFDRMLTRLTFTAPDGSQTELVDAAFNGEPKGNPGDCTLGHSRGHVWYSTNGSAMTFISDAPISDRTAYNTSSPSGNLMTKDGTKYRIDNGRITSIRDRNGNLITFSDLGGGRSVITDPLKRVIETQSTPTMTTITYKGFGGDTRTISIVSDDSNFLRPDFSSLHTNGSAFPEIPNLQFPNQSVGTVTSFNRIILPDNRQYKLWFNNYGEIARVDLPTGGRIEYDYVAGTGAYPSGMFGGSAGIYRRVATRRVYLNTTDAMPVEETKYTAVNDYSENQIVIVRQVIPGTETNLSYTKHYIYGSPIASYNQNPVGYRNWNDGLEWKTEYYDANGTGLIRRIERDFQPRVTRDMNPEGNPVMVSFDPQLRAEVTYLSPNLVTKKTYSYDEYNNVTGVNEYGFGTGAPGPLVRRTQTTYLTNNPYQDNINYATDPNIHIRNLPTSVSVFDGNDNEVSRTHFDYDRYNLYPLQDCPNIVQHDGGFNTGYTTRGNVTKFLRWLLPSTEVATYSQHNIAGNVVRTIDPRGNPTYVSYNDSFGGPDNDVDSNAGPPQLDGGLTYAFPTQVTNALGHTTYTQYDYHLGAPVNTADANGIVSSIAYDDPLDRPTQSIHARYKVGGGVPSERRQATFTYDDANRVITTTSDLATFNDNALTSKSFHDGLNRTWRSASDEGTTWSITDTRFDARGKVSQVSNPYRAADPDSASPPPGLWTKTTYDTLGRDIDVESPDGAHVTTQYVGNRVTVIDQTGKRRLSETDPFGKLIKVTEDPNVLKYETSYSYDALGNLLEVKQGTQRRTFDYDSLSRRLTATNPENGTITYAYDFNSNLIEKTDARGVKTTMTYDALNRATSRVYSGTTDEGRAAANLTKPAFHFYDDYSTLPSGAPAWPGTPSKGRLIGVTYGTGSDGYYQQYDAAGRVVTGHQRMGSSNYVTRYTYNLADSVLTEKRRNARDDNDIIRINSIYDAAGRLTWIGTSFTPFLSESILAKDITYTPFGGLQSEKYGNGLIHSRGYNNRLQPTEIRLGQHNNLESIFSIYNIYGTANNPNVPDPDITLFAQNNGNIARTKYYISGTLQYTQTHLYDALNRLKYAVEHNNGNYTDEARAWYQTFEYDFAGNRGIDTANTSDNLDGTNTALRLAEFSAANNRITRSDYAYDSAGNLIAAPGQSYTYDGADRLVKAVVGGVVSEYVYDALGQRVKKTVGGVGTRFEYSPGGKLIGERNDSTGALTKAYFYRNGELIATTEDGTTHKFATSDHLGTPRAWTDRFGNLTEGGRDDFAPFGEDLTVGVGIRTASLGYGSDSARQKFTGYEKDDETGLYFAQSRYLSSIQGRFTSPDIPFADQYEDDPQSWNLYAYGRNNPCSNTDPTGRRVCYYTKNGSKIACEGDTRLQIEPDRLILTPKKGMAPLVYDLNTVDAVFQVAPGGANANDLIAEMQIRAPGIKATIGVTIAVGVAGGGAIGYFGLGSTLSFLGRQYAPDIIRLFSNEVKKGPIPNEQPANLAEQMTMQEAQAGAGREIMRNLADKPRLEANYGRGDWVKMEHMHKTPDGRQINIHWFRNKSTNQNVEFKFKHRFNDKQSIDTTRKQ
jgi:RHS repeat-associated protein